MENERFELQNVEMAASSSKMLQIARKTDRTADKKKPKTGKTNPKTIPDPFMGIWWTISPTFTNHV